MGGPVEVPAHLLGTTTHFTHMNVYDLQRHRRRFQFAYWVIEAAELLAPLAALCYFHVYMYDYPLFLLSQSK
jgi:hypothetical protein